jgi:hypothetical protein
VPAEVIVSILLSWLIVAAFVYGCYLLHPGLGFICAGMFGAAAVTYHSTERNKRKELTEQEIIDRSVSKILGK